MNVLVQESRILPTKLAHPCESDIPIKNDRASYSRSERETQPYKDRAFQGVPHQDSKGFDVIRRTIALVWIHNEAWEGEEQRGGGNSLQSVLHKSMIMNQISNEAVIGMTTK